MKEIKTIIEKLEIILSYFSDFFNEKHKEDIKKLSNDIDNLKNNNLNNFDNNQNTEYNQYIKNYFEKARKLDLKKNSIFFNEIYKENKKKKLNEDECLKQTKDSFQKLKILFEDKKGVKKIDEKILITCLKPFHKKGEDEINAELYQLIEIFEIDTEKKKIELNEIQKDLLLILKRDYIYNIALSIQTFIKKIEPKLTSFNEEINNVIDKLNKKKDINTIKECKKKLLELKIDIDIKDNPYIDILLCLKEKPIVIIYLFRTNIEECNNLKELALQSDNNYVNINDIIDLEKCIEFFQKIGTLKDLKKKQIMKFLIY